MKIFIVGLGLIGASYAEGLHQAGHHVFGYDRDNHILNEAKKLHLIDEDSSLERIKDVDLLILALYPKDNVEFIKTHQTCFKPGLIVTDVSGTKAWMMNEIEKHMPEGITYTSTHPMAGRETSGFYERSPYLFTRANLMIVRGSKSGENDEKVLRVIASDLKFGKISVVDAETHDRLVALTSQLTHILAVCLMHADHEKETKEATGDSFRDLTRIAKINESMWSELFLENKTILIDIISSFEKELDLVKDMILSNDQEGLKTYLRQAKEKRKTFDIH
ncbi:MAG: hypothetical protein A2Y45_04690 [Tenericutes bacterium GWC2_34_14]|nr:MAG: hypothetical protein A2Y45_04690 [Tenericutes bacterium GWC2_34_14]OHE34055.1 MAG: hypothetical protein A2012_05345 [Tenericutes bacterium GWE2_34_108]OHE35385.1 MAG: hypothetical protein A2Y46_04690 [Tenericutes bacterium GWF1_35_14]OHE38469.1 MAG: hypothetical protein A2Y44_08055 [Tenericutes bacterium GWF2_35_184]OHE43110.1 MAG: hypothetical protein A2221_05625 [Tenericutes bacterium RIFOXYA2_FULL_36_32]OHE47026.1 MAG: hypothetical protein A3K26_06065 [Tenericutes bacterium RIFOXYA1